MLTQLSNGGKLPEGVTTATLEIQTKYPLEAGESVSVYDQGVLLGTAVPNTVGVPQDGTHFKMQVTVSPDGNRYTAKVTGGVMESASNDFNIGLTLVTNLNMYSDPLVVPDTSTGAVSNSGVTTATISSSFEGFYYQSDTVMRIVLNTTVSGGVMVFMPTNVPGAIISSPWLVVGQVPTLNGDGINSVFVPEGVPVVMEAEVVYNGGASNFVLDWDTPAITTLSIPYSYVPSTGMSSLRINYDQVGVGTGNYFDIAADQASVPKILMQVGDGSSAPVGGAITFTGLQVSFTVEDSPNGTYFALLEDDNILQEVVVGSQGSPGNSGIRVVNYMNITAPSLFGVTLTPTQYNNNTVGNWAPDMRFPTPDANSLVTRNYAVARLTGSGGTIVSRTPNTRIQIAYFGHAPV